MVSLVNPSLSLPSFGDLKAGAGLLWSLQRFLRQSITPEQALSRLRRRLQERELDFLGLIRRTVYQHPPSPYRQLLSLSGCEYGDLEVLVKREGVEGALDCLYRRGVYLSVDEFKGRQSIVRGSMTLTIQPEQLRNPTTSSFFRTQTSGSGGRQSGIPFNLAFLQDWAVNRSLVVNARGGRDWVNAHWGVPGSTALVRTLEFCYLGSPPRRWFSQVDPTTPGLHARYRWSEYAVAWGSRLAGVHLPDPEYVPTEHPLAIAKWMSAVLQSGATPHLFTFASAAVRVCQAAREGGIDLSGARFTIGGEPITAARMAVVREIGAEALIRYASMDGGLIGEGCLAPQAPDDVHVFHDLQALIPTAGAQTPPEQRNGESRGGAPGAFLVSSLRSTMPLILLNVSLGDQATFARRACGCPLERLGWTTHLSSIRSHEKLTAGGMTFLDTDVIRVLEQVLPARFGGGATDYQLVEAEADDGKPRLQLLVHPAVGPMDSGAVADTFLTALGTGGGAERVMELQWRELGLLRVERRAPLATPSGKILHLHRT